MNSSKVDPEVLRKNCLAFFNNDELAVQVWMSKYALKNLDGDYLEEGPIDRFRAIASELGRIDKNYLQHPFTYTDYEDQLISGSILPGGSGLFGIANPYAISSLGNCFVTSLNNEDSYGAILKIDEELVQIAKRRGGVGTDLSALRPSRTPVSNAAGSSTGAVSFVSRYSNSAREVAQNGRRGALMLTLHINHPDVVDFIDLKLDPKKATGANLSLRVTDEFMNAVECDGTHTTRFPVDSARTDEKTARGKMPAKELWTKMMTAAWKSAEPGILFWDKIISESPADCYPGFKTESTNPCGEIPLSAYDSCRLLSVNLTSFVRDPYTSDATFRWSEFRRSARIATTMMDNIIDLEIEKLDAILAKLHADKEMEETKHTEIALWERVKHATIQGRRAGISVIGHGDMFAMLGAQYATDEANVLALEIQKVFAIECYKTSIELAEERGSFPAFDHNLEKDNPFLKRVFYNDHELRSKMKKVGRRHIALLTLPPSGSLSILLGNQTSGAEPAFALFYTRKRKVEKDNPNITFVDLTGDCFQEYLVVHPGFKQWLSKSKYSSIDTSLTSNLETLMEIAKESSYANSTSSEIDPIKKVQMQGMIQQYIDHSVSITHNLPKTATVEDVSKIYMEAWKNGCKGCTVYRDGSRDGILNVASSPKTDIFEYRDSIKRPKSVECDIFYPTINGELIIVIVGLVNGKPFEVFALKDTLGIPQSIHKGILYKQKSKYYNLLTEDKKMLVENIGTKFAIPEWNAITRLLSWGLRHGGDITFAVEQLNESEGVVTDVSKVLARTLKKYVKVARKGELCPVCGASMRVEGGCSTCHECGFSKCS